MTKRIYTTLLLSLVLLGSCTAFRVETDGDSFVVRTRDAGMESKAGQPFSEGTSYMFFAFNRSESTGATEFTYPATIQAVGTESAQGQIEFAEGTRNHFGGRRMDFYGLTYADSDPGHWDPAKFTTTNGNAPKYNVTRHSSGVLEDLRLGVLQDVSSASSAGHLEVDFHHALSKLRFMAVRQNADNLEGIYITSISVWDHASGTLDLSSGLCAGSGARTEREVYSYTPDNADAPEESKKLTPSASLVAEALVFPAAEETVKVRVRTHNPTFRGEHEENLAADLEQEFIIPVEVLRNHEYTLSITITNHGVRIIIMTPQEEDWIPNDEGEMVLGQPVTFAGITWADRNLGATFAPENNKLENISSIRDWDNMRGYLFQFGRNVPYFILKNKKIGNSKLLYTDFANNDYTYCNSGKDRTNAPYALLDGESIKEAYDAAIKNKSWADVETGGGVMPLAFTSKKRNVNSSVNYVDISDFDRSVAKDANRFAPVTGNASDSDPWWVIDNSKKYKGTPDTWDEVSRQPVPKGWRIPTKEDWAYIMPLSKRTGDITFHPGSYTESSVKKHTYTYLDAEGVQHSIPNYHYMSSENIEYCHHYRNHNVTSDGYAWWAETGGDRMNVRLNGTRIAGLDETLGDPVAGYTTQYLCVSPKSHITRGTLYAIKCVGTNEAYRLKWEFVIHSDMPSVGARNSVDIKPVTMRISRYVANASDRLENMDDLAKLDWDNPAEVMELPDCGYLFTQEKPVLVNAGNETVYASSTVDPSDGYYYAVRLKYNEFTDGASLGSRYLMLIKMRRAYGMSIRPVRDNSVVIE